VRRRPDLFEVGDDVAPLVALVVVSILFGISEPASLLLQGAGLAVVSIAWVVTRRRGTRASAVAAAGRGRLVGGALMLLLGAAVASVVGSHLPGVDSQERFILRDQADPPFDPRTHPSPLAGYRRYTDDSKVRRGQREETIFTVTGLPNGAPIRLAVLDRYDGVVWNVAGGPDAGADSSGVFERVGESIPGEKVGKRSTVRFEIGDYSDIWLPTVGEVRGIHFDGPRREVLADALRFNRATNTGAVPVVSTRGLAKGDVVEVTADYAPPPQQPSLGGRPAGTVSVPEVGEIQEELKELAALLVNPPDDPSAVTPGYDRVARVQSMFTSPETTVGFGYSDGLATSKNPSNPGHSKGRLGEFALDYMEKGVAFGNGEQYAAALALIARELDVPSRVVMGFCKRGCGGSTIKVKGKDVSAWVEVNIDGYGWVPLDATPDPNKEPDVAEPQKRQKADDASQPPPPPVTTPPPEEAPTDEDPTRRKSEKKEKPLLSGTQLAVLGIAGTPILLVGGFVIGVLGLKRRRRRHRRTGGSLEDRVVGGWDELRDLALDMGQPIPPVATRREAAQLLSDTNVSAAAGMADLAVFGPDQPLEEDVVYYWDAIDASSESLLQGRSRIDRAKVRVNPTSLLVALRRGKVTRPSDNGQRAGAVKAGS